MQCPLPKSNIILPQESQNEIHKGHKVLNINIYQLVFFVYFVYFVVKTLFEVAQSYFAKKVN